ncbi:hypothetical protein ACM39_09040 [Chryseobacterium sp. FH2]|uniref:TIGR04139 family peptide modification target n=1 Tax=Chryseobacterium sp. FH2 TaxID=1674291 RepID=UPI00065ADA36|nr:TIGR04139 family peptide modification target [Chryseobacterium sp. FH2]KMQ68006.1 hypothetical protein ACM39_09040 [Chryseobacterium sp. FH2]
MKKLTGMKKNFSSLENKKLSSLSSINGGLMAASNDTWSNGTCDNGCEDVYIYVDGVRTGGGQTGADC